MGFRGTSGTSSRPFVSSFLVLFAVGAMLLSSGCSGFVTASNPTGNPVSLAITNASAANATPTSVGVDWQTNVPASSQVEYGATTSYGSMTALDLTMVTSHQLTVSSLKPGTPYHCRVHSTDSNNNSAVSADLSCTTSTDTTPPTSRRATPI